MRYSNKFFLLLLFTLSFLTACRKDSLVKTDVIIPPDPVVMINTGVSGLVMDEAGQAITDATVHLGNSSTLTDERGFFSLIGQVNQVQLFVSVEKAGYFPSLASFSAKAGSMGRVKVILREKASAKMVDASTGGQVDVPGGGSIQFQANSFETASGQAYSGTVMVYATYLDPSDAVTARMIPASFQGLNAAGEAQSLLSFGMIHALLESPAGEKLQINKPAEITVPVPADRIASAPSEIPLWYIDESTSIWTESGSAQLSGSSYKGQVSHFSWWNCDMGFPVIELSGTLRLGSYHPYVEIRITRPNGSSAGTTPSTSGAFSGKVPANEILILEVINECGEVVYSETIGPFSSDTNLGLISLDWTTDWVELSGTLLDCDQQPVTNGYISASINSQGIQSFPILLDPVTGVFEGVLANCGGTEVSLTGYDLTSLKSSTAQTLPVNPLVDFGDVVACDVQIVPGMLFEYGNGGDEFFPDITATYIDGAPSDTIKLYNIIVNDNQGADAVLYDFTLLDWNNNPMNPFWSMSYQTTIFGSPVLYELITQGSTIEAINQGTLTGELVIIKISNVTITEQPANIVHPNSTITLTAVLQ